VADSDALRVRYAEPAPQFGLRVDVERAPRELERPAVLAVRPRRVVTGAAEQREQGVLLAVLHRPGHRIGAVVPRRARIGTGVDQPLDLLNPPARHGVPQQLTLRGRPRPGLPQRLLPRPLTLPAGPPATPTTR
jgi:hypothetical protein